MRFQARTIERIVAWAGTAAEPSELAAMHTRQWQQLNEVRRLFDEQIAAAEREMAGFLVKTPYVLLLSVRGINVVSAARLAGEAGPIEHYASARAINGRAGLYPRGTKATKSIMPTARSFVSATASCVERPCSWPRT